MQPKALILSLFLALGSAQSTTVTPTASPTTTSSGSGSTSTPLASLVAQLPTCALPCLAQAAKDISCSPTDFSCLCKSSSALISKIGPCIAIGSGCSTADINNVTSIAPKICEAVQGNNVNSSDVASASSLVSSALATVTGTATASGNGAVRTNAAIGAMGLAAGFAVLAL